MRSVFFTFFICFLCFFNICRSESSVIDNSCSGIYNRCINELNTVYNEAIKISKAQNDDINVISQSNQALSKINEYITMLNNASCNEGYALQLENKKDEYSKLIIEYTKSTNTEDFKSNGVAKAICYAIDLITGKFGRAIMSLFIILVGMSFLSGRSEAVSFKFLISIALALSLIFGSAKLANIISGNTYSCEMVNK